MTPFPTLIPLAAFAILSNVFMHVWSGYFKPAERERDWLILGWSYVGAIALFLLWL